MNIVKRNSLTLRGNGDKILVLAHGYGCSQKMWDEMSSFLEKDYRLILFDHVGSGSSDSGAYDKIKYATLEGYAHDLLEIIEHLKLENVFFVGHSVSATIGMLASNILPDVFRHLVLVSPSPCFINKENYHGGFEPNTIESIIQSLYSNFDEWAQTIAPILTGMNDVQSSKLIASFCSTKPDVAKHFAMVTFTSDHRDLLPMIRTKTHIVQCLRDNLVPTSVGKFMNQMIKNSEYYELDASGHCPHLTHPHEVAGIIKKLT